MQTPPARARHRTRRTPGVGARLGLLGVLGAAPVAAQRPRPVEELPRDRPLAVEVGGVGVAQRGASTRVAPVLGVEWAGTAPRDALRAGAWTSLGPARWSGQVELAGAHRLTAGAHPLELAAAASAQQFPGATAVAFGEVGLRQHLTGVLAARPMGAWLGASAGAAQRGVPTQPRGALELGGWQGWGQAGRVALVARAQWARLNAALVGDLYDGDRAAATRLGRAPVPRPFRAIDLTLTAERRTRLGELALWMGARRSADADDAAPWRTRWQPLALATATRWMTPGIGVTASAGVQYADPLRALPGLRHASLGVRLRPTLAPVARDVPAARAVVPTGEAAVRVEPGPRGARLLVVYAPGAARLALRGDLTAWRETPLVRDGDAWTLPAEALALRLTAGTYRVQVRRDGDTWRPPANLPAVDDDFASRVGLLVVP